MITKNKGKKVEQLVQVLLSPLSKHPESNKILLKLFHVFY